jgi:hypothetical protein
MQFPVDLTETNVRKLINGHPIQLNKTQLHGSKHYLVVHPMTHSKMSVAKAKGKGVRITLTQPEVMASGEGFMDILRNIKKGAMWVKQHVIDTPFYQSAVKPVVKELVDIATTAASNTLPAPIGSVVKAGARQIGDVTNAYGLPISKSKASKPKPKPKNVIHSLKPKPKPKPKPEPVGGSFLIN